MATQQNDIDNVDEIDIFESYNWLESKIDAKLDIGDLEAWLVIGEKRQKIVNETNFCNEENLKKIVSLQSKLDSYPNLNYVYNTLRKSLNPFEIIGKSVFVNRDSVKFANIDALYDNMFTKPVNTRNELLIKSNEILKFVVIGDGSDGFTDYMLWRYGLNTKGFAFTRSQHKFHSFASKAHSFQMFYDHDKTMEIHDPHNVNSFIEYINEYTQNSGVHIVFNDTAILAENDEIFFKREILLKRLHLITCAIALSILQENGSFIMKMFDHLTPFTVGLIYIMYKCFHKISICKPNSSRPACSERYLICKWKKSIDNDIVTHLLKLNETIMQLDDDKDAIEIVSLDVLKNDSEFFQYIFNSNNEIILKQILYKEKMIKINDDGLKSYDLRTKCLKLWNLPENMTISDEISLYNGDGKCSKDYDIPRYFWRNSDLTQTNKDNSIQSWRNSGVVETNESNRENNIQRNSWRNGCSGHAIESNESNRERNSWRNNCDNGTKSIESNRANDNIQRNSWRNSCSQSNESNRTNNNIQRNLGSREFGRNYQYRGRNDD